MAEKSIVLMCADTINGDNQHENYSRYRLYRQSLNPYVWAGGITTLSAFLVSSVLFIAVVLAVNYILAGVVQPVLRYLLAVASAIVVLLLASAVRMWLKK